jgi:hypothetical protein
MSATEGGPVTREGVLRWGGVASGGLLVAFGIAVIVMALIGRGIVDAELGQQKIVGTPDMSPAGIQPGIDAAKLDVEAPDCDVAGKPIDSGSRARCFSEYMHIHALESSGGYVYAEMGQYLAKPGTPDDQLTPDGATNNTEFARIDPETGKPAPNAARNIWVTETALATGLDVAYMSSLIVLFTLVVGVALLLAGVGLVILALGLIPPRSPKGGAAVTG